MKGDDKSESAQRRETGPQAPVRVMHIMEQLGMAPNGLPLGRLAERLGTPKSTLLSFLRTLESAGYVRNAEGVYRIAELGIRLGTIISHANPFPGSLHTALVQAMELSGETTLLGVMAESGREVVYVDMVESRSAIRFSATIGTRRPLYCTAPGKALLAAQSDEWIEEYIAGTQLVRHLPKTIADEHSLREEIARIRSTGVAETHEEYTSGVSGFAAAIYDLNNRPVATMVIAAPTSRALHERKRLRDCAQKSTMAMSKILGATFVSNGPGHAKQAGDA